METLRQDCRDLPKDTMRWKEPSTIWKAQPVMGFFKEKNGQYPAQVEFRNFPPT